MTFSKISLVEIVNIQYTYFFFEDNIFEEYIITKNVAIYDCPFLCSVGFPFIFTTFLCFQFERAKISKKTHKILSCPLRSIYMLLLTKIRSSLPEVFYKNGVLRNFAKFTGKHLCQSIFLNKVAGLRHHTSGGSFLKMRSQAYRDLIIGLLFSFFFRCKLEDRVAAKFWQWFFIYYQRLEHFVELTLQKGLCRLAVLNNKFHSPGCVSLFNNCRTL